jgi:citrate lyase beta subunit
VREVRAFREAEAAGRGAVMIDGHMADRATDRVQRVVLRHARARGLLNDDLARELGID